MINRVFFLFMAMMQVVFALRLLRNPQAAKAVNIQLRTIWARLPLVFYRGLGVLCAIAAIIFFYLFLNPPISN